MPSSMTFQFLDVGMGDGTLVQIRQPNEAFDRLILVDFGEKRSQFKIPYEDALQYLVTTIDTTSKKRGKKTPFVDALVLTHPDGDHYNKIPNLVDAKFPSFPGKRLRFGDLHFSGKTREYGDLMDDTLDGQVDAGIDEMVQNYHSEVDVNGDVTPTWTFGDVNIFVLSANWPKTTGPTNPKSVVLMFDLDGESVILPGDAERKTEIHILNVFKQKLKFLRAYGLKLGHHGSKGASSEIWVTNVLPDAIFASGDFAWSHPYCEAICRYVDGASLPAYFKKDIWYCCGDAGAYYNNKTRDAICMNLWYMVDHGSENLIEEDSGKAIIGFLHNTFGVQWAMEIATGKADHEIFRTEAVRPAPGQKVTDPWDCDATARAALGIGAPAVPAVILPADR
jgi:beta-lactamase superfamily II metal-dependent hydrolase